MKPTVLVLPCILLLTSCNYYQYYTLTGDNTSKNEKNEFIAENDTLKLIYSFSGNKNPVQVTIFNKTDEPVEINWQKSAIIVNGKATSYYTPDVSIQGVVEIDTFKKVGNSIGGVTFEANANAKEERTFIPPQSTITKIPVRLDLPYLNDLNFKNKKERLQKWDNTTIATFKRIHFNEASTPLQLRTYLTFKLGTDAKEVVLQHHFFASEIFKTQAPPEVFYSGNAALGNSLVVPNFK